MLDDWLQPSLTERRNENLLRELRTTRRLKDFCSNDYLGLAQSKDLKELIDRRYWDLDLWNGATGSRLISGNAEYTEEVEATLAKIFDAESALIFNSGYTANIALFASIPKKGDTILLDELVHASIKDGARLSFASRFTFKHNDINDLEAKLKRANGKKFIAVESIYSMDGDVSPLKDIVEVAKKFDACVILDEAHSTGVLGTNGGGLAKSLGLAKEIHIRLMTFGKAMGIHGACVAGSKVLREYLINFARPFIYTTALAPHNIVSIETAFQYLSENISLQEMLKDCVKNFLQNINKGSNRTASNSAIQTIICPGNENARAAAYRLQNAGFDVRPILSPTVPAGTERLRICIHTFNTSDEIKRLCIELKNLTAF